MSRVGGDSSRVFRAFRAFKRYLPHVSLDDLRFLVSHASFETLRLALPAAVDADALVGRLAAHAGDAVCARAICAVLDVDYTRFQFRAPDGYVQLLETVAGALPAALAAKVARLGAGRIAGAPPALAARFGAVLVRRGMIGGDVVDAAAFVAAVAHSRESNVIRPIAELLAIVAGTGGGELARIVGICSDAIDAAAAAIAKEHVCTLTVYVIVKVDGVVENLIGFQRFLREKTAPNVTDYAFYPALLECFGEEDARQWARMFVERFDDAQVKDYGGRGRAAGFFRSVVETMEVAQAREIVGRFRGGPVSESGWRMLAVVFECFPEAAAEFREILAVGDQSAFQSTNQETRRAVETVLGGAPTGIITESEGQEMPRSESSGGLEQSGSDGFGFQGTHLPHNSDEEEEAFSIGV
jgi:hypothetical protein